MATLEFQELSFEKKFDCVRFYFLDNYYFDVENQKLSQIGSFSVKKNSITFKADENSARKKLNMIIENGFKDLRNIFNNKKTIYIHKNMNMPLIGLNYFGIVDRNTSLVEVKPLTGCNLNCIYCSVDEGLSSKKQNDFVIEKDFLVQELKKLIKQKNCNEIEIYINPNGEPLLYKPLPELAEDISNIEEVKNIILNTNGALLDKKKIDELAKSGINQFNVSLNSIDEEIAKKMAGINYDTKKVIDSCKYIASKYRLVIAPVLVPGYNEKEIPKLIEFAKKLNARIGIQNFLNYQFGRNPCKSMDFEEFYKYLSGLERDYKTKLVFGEYDFGIKPTEKLKKPFDKGDIIKTEIICEGRLKNEKIAFSKDRLLTIPNCQKSGAVKTKIVRSKHNIFVGVLV
jgi:uncharacterized Fe-S cluster-containing radical SAM superfamily enzyme